MLHESTSPRPGAAAAPAGVAAATGASAPGAVVGETTAPGAAASPDAPSPDAAHPAARKPRNHGVRRSRKLWLRRECMAFCEVLAETADPALAAASVGHSVLSAFAMRDRDQMFANEWDRALAIAWEMVEMRLLAQLLDRTAPQTDLAHSGATQGAAAPADPPARPAAPAAARRDAEKAFNRHQTLVFALLEARLAKAAAAARPVPAPAVTRVHGTPVEPGLLLKLREAMAELKDRPASPAKTPKRRLAAAVPEARHVLPHSY